MRVARINAAGWAGAIPAQRLPVLWLPQVPLLPLPQVPLLRLT